MKILTLAAVGIIAGLPDMAVASSSITADEAGTIAKEAYIFGAIYVVSHRVC